MKRTIAIVLAAVFCFALLAGCGETATTTTAAATTAGADPTTAAATTTAAPAAAPVTLKVITMFGGDDGNRKNYEEAYKAWEAQTGNTVQDQSATADETWKAQVRTDFATGNIPDVLNYFSGPDCDELVNAGYLVSIDTIRAEYPQYASNISAGALAQCASTADGVEYCIPVRGFWEGLFVNTDVLAAAGATFSNKWDGFVASMEAIKAAGKTPIAVALAEVPHYIWEFILFNYTGVDGHLTVPTSNADANYANYVAALNEIKWLFDQGFLPSNTNNMDDQASCQMFYDKDAAYLMDGSWKTNAVLDASTDASVVELMSFPGKEARDGSEMLGGFSSGFFITKQAWDSEKRDAAVSFVSYISSTNVVAKFNSDGAASPVTEPINLDGAAPLVLSALAAGGNASGWAAPVQDIWNADARTNFFKNIPQVVEGSMTPEAAVDQLISENV